VRFTPIVSHELFNIMGVPLYGANREAFPINFSYLGLRADSSTIADGNAGEAVLADKDWSSVLGNAVSSDALGPTVFFALGNTIDTGL